MNRKKYVQTNAPEHGTTRVGYPVVPDMDQLMVSGVRESEDHDHEWVVFSTALQDVWLMVQCVECGLHGTVDDPTREEWAAAYYAPVKPYRWPDSSRVTVRPSGPRYVARSESSPAEYERIPRELMGAVLPVTTEEREELESLIEIVAERLDGRLFPLFLRSCEQDTGHEPTGAAKRLASRLERFCEKGYVAPPDEVARALKWYAREGGAAEKRR